MQLFTTDIVHVLNKSSVTSKSRMGPLLVSLCHDHNGSVWPNYTFYIVYPSKFRGNGALPSLQIPCVLFHFIYSWLLSNFSPESSFHLNAYFPSPTDRTFHLIAFFITQIPPSSQNHTALPSVTTATLSVILQFPIIQLPSSETSSSLIFIHPICLFCQAFRL